MPMKEALSREEVCMTGRGEAMASPRAPRKLMLNIRFLTGENRESDD